MTIGTSIDCPKSDSSFFNQSISHVTIIAFLYFPFVFRTAIVGYFLLFQLITPFPKENMKPLVDFLSETLLTQSTSIYPCTYN